MSFDEDKIENEMEKSQRYLQFDLGNESYAIALLNVKEVIPVPETTPLPNAPTYYIGIMNLRGQIISIVDLRKRLKINKKEDAEEAVIIVDFAGVSIGLVVDSINYVLNVATSEITEVPEIRSQVNAQYVQGVHRGQGKLTIMLDLAKALNISEIAGLQKNAA
ncbi:MAG: chemotaxis protein CheW [Halobacteriovoraceae bacterium]|nr:chemotaxis protein CheW [Halobacteriovoraceae bacterium]|tara:strand:+ start:290 stop:778 length:489 start_codon:yes stop_codon:yes gene_type:complete